MNKLHQPLFLVSGNFHVDFLFVCFLFCLRKEHRPLFLFLLCFYEKKLSPRRGKNADVQPPASVVQISPKRRDQIERNVTEEGEKDKDLKNDNNNNNKREKKYIHINHKITPLCP